MLYRVLQKLLTASLYLCVSLIIVACEGNNEPTETALATPTSSPTPSAKSISANLSGVQVAVAIPPGWSGRKMDGGILIAEQRGSMHNTGRLMGMQIYVFVHSISSFPGALPSESHLARSILEEIVSQPDMVGDSSVSHPETFMWDGNDAAYYMLNDGKNVSLVMAVVVANQSQLMAINISCPLSRAESIRESLPKLLQDLWVNDELMSTTILASLPDPLVFPDYDQETTTPKPMLIATSTP